MSGASHAEGPGDEVALLPRFVLGMAAAVAPAFCERNKQEFRIPEVHYDLTVPRKVSLLGLPQIPCFKKPSQGTINKFPRRGRRRRVPDFFIIEGSNPPVIDASQSTGQCDIFSSLSSFCPLAFAFSLDIADK